MAEVNGDTFSFYQGENPDLVFPVTHAGAAYDLTGGKATLTYWLGSGTATKKVCTILTTNVTASFTHEVTQLLAAGIYNFQLMCKNAAGQKVMSKVGFIEVLENKDPDAVE